MKPAYTTINLGNSKKTREGLASFYETLFRNGTVVVKNLGRFEVREVKARTFYSGLRKEVVKTKQSFKVHFIPYGVIRKKICKK